MLAALIEKPQRKGRAPQRVVPAGHLFELVGAKSPSDDGEGVSSDSACRGRREANEWSRSELLMITHQAARMDQQIVEIENRRCPLPISVALEHVLHRGRQGPDQRARDMTDQVAPRPVDDLI